MLVEPFNLETYSMPCLIPTGLLLLSRIGSKEVMMKRDLKILYCGLGYEEGFCPIEVMSSQPRKRSIDTCTIMDAANSLDIKEVFSEGGVIPFF